MILEQKKKNVPALRFPEFQGEWANNTFGEVVSNTSSKYNPETENRNYQCIELECLTQETGILLNTFDSDKLKSIKNKFNIGDVLYGKLRPYLKKYYLADFSGVCSTEIWVLRSNLLVNRFLYNYVQTDGFNQVANLSTGSKMPRAEWNIVANSGIFYPSIPEQQKIADFLSAVDGRIQQLTQKKELLEQYKKGAMQQIFSQQIRFKDDNGSDYPEWEEKKLGEIAQIKGRIGYRGYTKSDLVRKGEGVLVIGGKHIVNNRLDISDPTYLSWEKYYESPEIMLKYQDIVFSQRGSLGDVAIINKNIGEATINPSMVIIRSIHIVANFLYYFLTSPAIQKSVKNVSTSTAVPMISQFEISNFSTPLPTKEEQERIAEFLNKIDQKIILALDEITQTKLFKKGLLQNMFV